MDTTRRLFLGIAVGVLAARSAVAARKPNRLRRIAFVLGAVPVAEMAGTEPVNPIARAFVNAMRELGLVDGRDIVIERRSAEGRGPERLSALMNEIVALGVDVIVTTGSGVRAAQRATDRIPIVGVVEYVLGSGLVDSLARPGKNVTGIGTNDTTVLGKELQLLRELVPTISRVGVIAPQPPKDRRVRWRDDMDASARAMGIDLLWLNADTPEEVDTALAAIARERVDALYAIGTHVTYAKRQRIADVALERRLPSVGFPEAGMVLSYSTDVADLMPAAARLVKKILDGAKPADLPFEQPTKYSLVINLKTARSLGIPIPQSVLLRADEVIQ